MIASLPGYTGPAETGAFADGDPDASLDDQAACLFTIACWCITSALAELSGNGWDAGQEGRAHPLVREPDRHLDHLQGRPGVPPPCRRAGRQADAGAGPGRPRKTAPRFRQRPRRVQRAAEGSRALRRQAGAAGQDRRGTVTLPAAGTET
jgi:hypothetical protein